MKTILSILMTSVCLGAFGAAVDMPQATVTLPDCFGQFRAQRQDHAMSRLLEHYKRSADISVRFSEGSLRSGRAVGTGCAKQFVPIDLESANYVSSPLLGTRKRARHLCLSA